MNPSFRQLSSFCLFSMGASRGAGAEWLVLRQPVFFHFRRAIFIRAAVHYGLNLEVTVWRW